MPTNCLKHSSALLSILMLSGQALHSQGQTLADTISFMDRSVEPELSSIRSVNSCEVYVARNRLYRFALPKGQSVNGQERYGVPHYSIAWMIAEEPSSILRFNFATIDPGSINSKRVPSVSFLKEHNVDQHPWELKQADLMLVTFETTNSTRSIENGHFSVPRDGDYRVPIFDHQSSMGFIVFESKERAERFVTAFVHAVRLCGGKGSDFAPTPSTP